VKSQKTPYLNIEDLQPEKLNYNGALMMNISPEELNNMQGANLP
jgi:hypothetical protein